MRLAEFSYLAAVKRPGCERDGPTRERIVVLHFAQDDKLERDLQSRRQEAICLLHARLGQVVEPNDVPELE